MYVRMYSCMYVNVATNVPWKLEGIDSTHSHVCVEPYILKVKAQQNTCPTRIYVHI